MATKQQIKKTPPKNKGGRPRTGRSRREYWILDRLHEGLAADAETRGMSASQLLESILDVRANKTA